MDNSTSDQLKELLMKENPAFKDLVSKHQKYEDRLSLLSNLHYPSDEEQEEESLLKKKKLALKDEIYTMISEYSRTSAVGH